MTYTCTCGAAFTRRRRRPAPRAHTDDDHRYCRRCWRRWQDHGYPASGPPAPYSRRRAGGRGTAAGRIEDYQWLQSPAGGSLTRAEAAARLGVTRRTRARYDARIRATHPALRPAA